MRISCLIDSLGSGGAERVMTLLAGGLAARGHDVTLTTLAPGVPDFHPVPPGVKRASAGPEGAPCRWYELARHRGRIAAVRAALGAQSPEAVISFIDATNIAALSAFPSGSPPVVACERVDPRYSTIGPHWRLLRRALYPRAARVVLQTRAALGLPLARGWKAVSIPNPVLPPPADKPARPALLRLPRNIAAAGRLTPQKGFDLLLRAFARLAVLYPDWQLTIMGEGPDRRALERLAAELGLAGRVAMPGTLPSLYPVLAHSDLFALSSRFEGFPNVLTEALAAGVPAVAFDCPSGPAEILRDGVDGLLVRPGRPEELAAALSALMGDEARRGAMAGSAPEVLRRFSLSSFLDSWEKLLADLPRPRP